MFRNKFTLSIAIGLGLVVLAVSLISINSAMSKEPATVTTSDVLWSWGAPVGTTSQLVRTGNGINADFAASGLTPDHAMTLWFIVFNYPDLCVAGPSNCGPQDLGKDRPAQGDFLVASGHVVGADGTASFGGHLQLGETAGSGLAEFPEGCIPDLPGCGGPVGLVSLNGALVILAVHSHGPKQTGAELKAQISSYLGGCEVFTGTLPGGFAASEAEIPVNDGECATIQVSPHAPQP